MERITRGESEVPAIEGSLVILNCCNVDLHFGTFIISVWHNKFHYFVRYSN